MAAARGGVLRERGVGAGDRVMLLSENRPEWGITYFGILKAGAAVVPVDCAVDADEVREPRRLGARARRSCLERQGRATRARARLDAHRRAAPRIALRAICCDGGADRCSAARARCTTRRRTISASLIFTSGTTGHAQGRDALAQATSRRCCRKLASACSTSTSTTGCSRCCRCTTRSSSRPGLLMPLMRGAQITYLEEIDADSLARAFDEGNVTGMVGVPALWQLLERKIDKQRRASAAPLVERAFDLARRRQPQAARQMPPCARRLGSTAASCCSGRCTASFGGRLRLLISGGSALPADTMKAFRGLGFNLYEGYGLTEASPVLTVNRPGDEAAARLGRRAAARHRRADRRARRAAASAR